MPLYNFSTTHHGLLHNGDDPIDLPDDVAAWAQGAMACGELLKELSGSLSPNEEWRLDVKDGTDLVFSFKMMPRTYR